MRVRTIKPKKAKEVKSREKEIKTNNNQEVEEEQEEEFDDSSSQGFESNGRRAAPVLTSEESKLEDVAATAPATQSAQAEENNKKLYSSTDYADKDYSDKKYTISTETDMRLAFEEDRSRMSDLFDRRRQQSIPGQQEGIRETWQQQQAAMPEKKYEADLDTAKSARKRTMRG